MAKRMTKPPVSKSISGAIAEIRVAGFKSIGEEQSIEIRPLTILAGANSSGKSSMMQPFLLLKQTLEAPYDAGPIMLNGPNVKFTSAEQLLARIDRGRTLDTFEVGMRRDSNDGFISKFRKDHKMGFRIEQMTMFSESREMTFWPGMTGEEIDQTGFPEGREWAKGAPEGFRHGQWQIVRDRCFLAPVWVAKHPDGTTYAGGQPGLAWESIIPKVIHLPGLRGNPERTYPVTATGPAYQGTFEKYTASLISHWAEEREEALDRVSSDLKRLGLSGGVTASRRNDVEIEVFVGRLPDALPTQPNDRVSIADVGIGVSQTLPLLVALHAATPYHLVYVEQPETHLHPRAQFELAKVLAAAAKRGVRIVVETHSSILLLGVQALVAEKRLEPELVKLHWFQRKPDGHTVVTSADLDEVGRFGDWPEDFDDVALQTQKAYLDAAEERLLTK